MRLEAEAIRALSPLLNYDGLPRFPPPLMRRPARSLGDRAQWLWHSSWAAVLAGHTTRLNGADRDRLGSTTRTLNTEQMNLASLCSSETENSKPA